MSLGGEISWIREKEEVKYDAQANGLATGQIIIESMRFRKKKGL